LTTVAPPASGGATHTVEFVVVGGGQQAWTSGEREDEWQFLVLTLAGSLDLVVVTGAAQP
jgi:hypothetical protein